MLSVRDIGPDRSLAKILRSRSSFSVRPSALSQSSNEGGRSWKRNQRGRSRRHCARCAVRVVVDHDRKLLAAHPVCSWAPAVGRARRATAAPLSYQPLLAFTIFTTDSMTGTSISTPTTVASAAPELKPNKLMAAATAREARPPHIRWSRRRLRCPFHLEGRVRF